ncbi:hypothetical protein D1871_12340 [Nakamurella silvestris]|nr:hypothetical protein D1871_12340 [Nakamurella silvestris]
MSTVAVTAVAFAGLLLPAGPAQAASPLRPAATSAAAPVVTKAAAAKAKATDTLLTGTVMHAGDQLVSKNGKYRMVVQADGNVVVLHGKKALFNTGTFGKGRTNLVLGPKGDLVVRTAKNTVLWRSHTKGKGAYKLVINNAGTLILYKGKGRGVWTSKTPAKPAPKPVDANAFYLPFPKGVSYRINQSPGGSASHSSGNSRYAIDFGMPTGSVVVASKAGTVRDAKWVSGGGGIGVLVDHGSNVCTFYAHLSSYSVSVGQKVKTGQRIALSGATGNATGPHLHFSLVSCSSYGALKVIKTVEMGTSYPQGTMAKSQNG